MWRPLSKSVVPVVYGADDVYKVAPANSYIDVRNFSSPKQLADYLLFLDHHDNAYLSYFAWKKHYRVVRGKTYYQNVFCRFCEYLHTDNRKKEVKKFTHWFFNDSGCKSPDIPF